MKCYILHFSHFENSLAYLITFKRRINNLSLRGGVILSSELTLELRTEPLAEIGGTAPYSLHPEPLVDGDPILVTSVEIMAWYYPG